MSEGEERGLSLNWSENGIINIPSLHSQSY